MKLDEFENVMRELAGRQVRITLTDGRVLGGICTGAMLSTKVGRRKEIVQVRPSDAASVEPVLLHLTHNLGQGSVILCGAERNQTYRSMADGTADRYVDRALVQREPVTVDTCRACLTVDAELPPPVLPGLFA